MAAYDTAIYPYPEAMWDEAAEHLATNRGWTTVLLTCPDPAATSVTAKQKMDARNVPNTFCLVYVDAFSNSHIIRISRLQYIDPRWDDVEHHLLNHSTVSLAVIDNVTVNANATMEEARAAMAERGIVVAVGYSAAPGSREGLLRIEKV